jgi:hypothetical protein
VPARRALDRDMPTERLDAILQADKAGAAAELGAADPVVAHAHDQRTVDGLDLESGTGIGVRAVRRRDGARGLGRLRALVDAREPSRQLGGCVGRAFLDAEVTPDVGRMRRAGAGRG